MNLIEKLNIKNQKIVNIIKNEAERQNIKAYIVGGPVRDLIMDNEIKDIDFLIEGNSIEFVKNANFKIKSLHEDFKTAKVEIENEEIDIASTRSEIYPKNGCLPQLTEVGIKIEDDLKRRDFTINAIAYDILDNKIIDPYFGKNDIDKKVLKILHNNSYKDDPTRILRGLDFKYRFDFNFSENDVNLIKECIKNFDNSGLSIDRIYLTLNKIFSSDNSDKILKDIINFEIYKIWTKNIGIKKEDILKLDNIINEFEIEDKSKFYLMALENCPYVKVSFKNDFEIYEFFKKFSNIQLAFYYFKTGDNSAKKYLKISNIKTFITGKTLLDNGFCQGEIIGIILNDVLKNKILHPDKFKTIDEELKFVFEKYSA